MGKKLYFNLVQIFEDVTRIPEKFYPEIAANEKQHAEWVKLFAIDEITGSEAKDMFGKALPAYSNPLTSEFLKANPFLLVDTSLFNEYFKNTLLDEVHNIDGQTETLLIHSENFSGLLHISNKYESNIKLVLTDPPYNTKADVFPYKDAYKHSSWMTMIQNRTQLALNLLTNDGIFFHHIDENEHQNAASILTEIFGEQNRVTDIVWKNSSKNGEDYISMQHEYIVGAVKNVNANKGNWKERKEGLDEIYKAFDGFKKKHGENWKAIHQDALDFFNSFPDSNPIKDSSHYSWMDESGVYFPDNISKPAKGYFYELKHPITGKPCKKPAGGWRFMEETMREKVRKNEIHFGDNEKTVPNNKTYLKNTEEQSLTSIKYKDGRIASNLLKDIFGVKDPFKNPKDVELTSRLLKALETNGETVLDYFAGSGTLTHSIIELHRQKQPRRCIAIEMGSQFDFVLLPRLKKAIYSKGWKDGKPVLRDGISHCFKYLRLESYEDALNNLVLREDMARDAALDKNSDLQRDYLLNYFLDVETKDSQSLLNIADFRDPTAYKMWIKKPGSEEQGLENMDLIETFNWLLGLWVDHMAAPQSFSAEFERDKDADLPADQNTRLLCKKLKPDAKGEYWFRLIEGYTLKVPGDNNSKQKTLVIWRKQTDDAEKDNAVLQKYLIEKLQISPRENTYAVIYINGSHTLPNPVIEGEQTKVRLIEEAFHNAMWTGENV